MNDVDVKKILIVRLSALGDTIHTLPLAFALKELFPSAQLDWIVEDKSASFLRNNPLINNLIVIPRRKWKKRKNKLKNFFTAQLQLFRKFSFQN